VAAGFRASDKSGCPGLTANDHHNRLNAIYELPCSPESIPLTAHSEAFRKGVLVQRCVSILLFLSVLCAVSPAAVVQSPPNSFASQITLDGKIERVGIGSTVPATTASLAGTMRSTDNKLQFCDGANWRNVSLDKAQ
jgi:hypothetical protein